MLVLTKVSSMNQSGLRVENETNLDNVRTTLSINPSYESSLTANIVDENHRLCTINI